VVEKIFGGALQAFGAVGCESEQGITRPVQHATNTAPAATFAGAAFVVVIDHKVIAVTKLHAAHGTAAALALRDGGQRLEVDSMAFGSGAFAFAIVADLAAAIGINDGHAARAAGNEVRQ
jgi:hypothetical protein